MISKRISFSNKKPRQSPLHHDDLPTSTNKSHLCSTHLKTSTDLYSNIYRLPLREILQQRRDDDNSTSLKKERPRQPVEITSNSNLKIKNAMHKSSRKISIHQQQQESARELRTDRSSREFAGGRTYELKRIRTELDNIGGEVCVKNELLQKKVREERREEYVSVKVEDLNQLLGLYSKLKKKNVQLTSQISFYEKELQDDRSGNSVFKALNA